MYCWAARSTQRRWTCGASAAYSLRWSPGCQRFRAYVIHTISWTRYSNCWVRPPRIRGRASHIFLATNRTSWVSNWPEEKGSAAVSAALRFSLVSFGVSVCFFFSMLAFLALLIWLVFAIAGFYRPRKLGHNFPRLYDIIEGETIANAFLQLNPEQRLGADEALQHPYFAQLPKKLYELPDGKRPRWQAGQGGHGQINLLNIYGNGMENQFNCEACLSCGSLQLGRGA